MRRNPKQSAASTPPKSAALAPQDAGFPARSGGPVGPPAWIPEDVDFHNMPEPGLFIYVGWVEVA